MISVQNPYGGFAGVYDYLMSDMPYGDWLGWLDAYWELNGRPSRVVDLGCGTGTISIPLAASGLRVVGIDISETMLSVAQHKEAAARSETPMAGNVQWSRQDMREWSWPEPADSAISLCDCMSYLLTEDDVRRTIERVWEGLAPGGTFIFDMHHRNQMEEYAFNEPFILDEEDVSYIWTCELDDRTVTVTHRLSFFIREGDRYVKVAETHRQRAYPAETIVTLLEEAGFTDVQSYSDFSFEPIDDDSTLRMFFAARKPA
ncbi:class I SAM-dependent DNA methyltransferase [Paenibacillus thermotolerans]|uniref:class I SAM-dependent DNA methyltransferase n=1 Tax=Paenibacillus thermotolerans TaxID=3027807 RepID=UPI0023684F92|nr:MULTISPECIES: class I SAM-dependent methyltransferase [unclassified Paenibacillus]